MSAIVRIPLDGWKAPHSSATTRKNVTGQSARMGFSVKMNVTLYPRVSSYRLDA